MRPLLLCFLCISAIERIVCGQVFGDGVISIVRRKIESFSPLQSDGYEGSNEWLQYDFVLRHLNLSLHLTRSAKNVLLARTRSNGRFYLLLGNTIQSIILSNDQIQLFPLVNIDDLNDAVSEFEAEEIPTQDNRRNLIVALYLCDRFQIYRISLESDGSVGVIKSVQKIRRSGQSTKTYLLVYMSNMYLITGYVESETGKIAVYRWLDYHFSVEDIKDVAQHNELIVHNHKQIVLQVLQSAQYPERSINHIYVLNEHRKMIKTQEMYFFFNRLPYYDIYDEIYILRCLALDKCFLYKWNGENLFLRVSKVGYDPRNIDLFGAGYNVAVMSLKGMLYVYYNQPLLKVASSYVVLDQHGTVVDTRFFTNHKITQMYVYKESEKGKMYLCLLYGVGTKIMECIALQLNKRRTIEPDQGEQASFNALKTCLANIKDIVNMRKGWIDLMKYQINNIRHVCTETGTNQLVIAKSMHVSGSNIIANTTMQGNLKTSPFLLFKWWNAMKGISQGIHQYSNHLFYVDRVNAMDSDLMIRGNLHTNAATLKCISVPVVEQQARRKRDYQNHQSLRNLAGVTISAEEIVFNGKLFSSLFYKTRVSNVALFTRIKNLHTASLRLKSRSINRIPVGEALFNANLVESGSKILLEIFTKSLFVSYINGKIIRHNFSSLKKIIDSRIVGDTVQLFGNRESMNLHIESTLNKIQCNKLLEQLYYGNKQSAITGFLHLQALMHIRNIHSSALHGISTNDILNLRSNQTIFACIQMYEVYTHKLLNRIVNTLNLPGNVTLASTTKLIKDVAASNFIVLGDLVLPTNNQHFTRHVLGTSVDDFSQVYTGRVFVKGSLALNKIVISGLTSQVYARGLPAGSAISNNFWMKHVEQNFGSFSFQRSVQITQLLCNELNYHPANTYLRSNNWYDTLHVIFSSGFVKGAITTFTLIPFFLRHIDSEAVQRALFSAVSGRKVFPGFLHTEMMVAELIDASSLQSLTTEGRFELIFNETKQIDYLIIKESDIQLNGQITAHNFHHEPFNSVAYRYINRRYLQTFNFISALDLYIEHLYSYLINGLSAGQFVAEADHFVSRTEKSSTQSMLVNLITKATVVSTKNVSIEHVNLINLREIFTLLTVKDTLRHREIGGNKLISSGAATHGNLQIVSSGKIYLNSILFNTVRASNPQSVISSWYLNNAESKSLIAKLINGAPSQHFLKANLLNPRIYLQITVQTLHVSVSTDGHITPNTSCALMPSNVESVSKFAVHEAISLQHFQLRTTFCELMLSGVTIKSEMIEQKIVFYKSFIDFEIIWQKKEIINKNSNFIDFIKDAVKRNQLLIAFNSAGRIVFDTTCLDNMISADLLLTSINGVDLVHLNKNIHVVDYYHGTVRSFKHFKKVLGAIHFFCNDALITKIYSQQLKVPEHATDKREQYHFQVPASVIGNMFVNAINDNSLMQFFGARAIKNLPISRESFDKSQQASALVDFSELIVMKEQNAIQSLNGIIISEIITEASSEHQALLESKEVLGNIHLIGPTSIIQCNTYDLIEYYKSSVLLYVTNLLYENLLFTAEVVLQKGISVQIKVNKITTEEMLKFQISAVDEFSPMTPAIRSQLFESSSTYGRSLTSEPHMLYVEHTNIYNSNPLRFADNHAVAFTNASDSIVFREICTSGVKQLNITFRTLLSNSSWKYDSSIIQGDLVRAEWKQITQEDDTQLLLLLVRNSDKKYVLNVHVHRENRIASSQSIATHWTEVKFQLLNVNKTLVLLALTGKEPFKQEVLIPRIKLYYFNSGVMRFIYFKTLSVPCHLLTAVAGFDGIMLAISEKNSNVLMIFAIDRPGAPLYQKIVFDSNITSLGIFELEDYPAIRIYTAENVFYLYVYSFLEGWKQYSYGRKAASEN